MYNYNSMSNNYMPNSYMQNLMATQQRLNQLEQQYYNNQNNNMTQNNNMSQNNGVTSNVTWIQVNGINGAKEHIVQPNQTAWLMDNNDSVFFVKSADNLGVTTLRCYKFYEINANEQVKENTVNYVLKSDFDNLKSRMEQLEQIIVSSANNIDKTSNNSQTQTMKQNKK